MSDGVLVCILRSTLPQVASVIRWCSVCGADIWVSETMSPRVDSGNLVPHCAPCSVGTMTTQKDVELVIAPEQEAELRTAGLYEDAMRFVRLMNRRLRDT